jgi:hypothetical protein
MPNAAPPAGYYFTEIAFWADPQFESDSPDLPRLIVRHDCGTLVFWGDIPTHDAWHDTLAATATVAYGAADTATEALAAAQAVDYARFGVGRIPPLAASGETTVSISWLGGALPDTNYDIGYAVDGNAAPKVGVGSPTLSTTGVTFPVTATVALTFPGSLFAYAVERA